MNFRRDQAFAKACVNCPVCRRARQRQHGIAYELVKRVEARICPFGRAYERVTGRRSHQPVPPE